MNLSNGLMCVLAHPDDESLALGGTLAMYAARGIPTSLVMATRGERGWTGRPADYPGPRVLGEIREAELRAAATALGIDDLVFLDEIDGELSQANQQTVVARITAEIRRVRPDVVVTFGPDGVYGHPDHIAISQLTTTAVVCAADPNYEVPTGAPAHRVAKLYYRICTDKESAIYRSVFGDVGIDVAGRWREWVSWPDWAISARLDTTDHWPEVREAVACHSSQLGALEALERLDPRGHRRIWGVQHFYRAMSVVATDPGVEDDLFAGLDDRLQRSLSDRLIPNGVLYERGHLELVTPT